jgi:hypothetical protein
MALGLWIVFRRSRARSQLVVATAHSATLATETPLAYHDERRASPEPVETAARGGSDDHAEQGVPPAEATPGERDGSNGDEHLALPPAANPSVATQTPEIRSEDAPAPAHGDDGVHASGPVATAEAASGAAEIFAGLELESEAAAFIEHDHVPLPEEGQEELADLANAVPGYEQPRPAPNESTGAEAPANEGLDSCGPLLSSPPEEMPLAPDDGDLADATGEASGEAPMASTSPGEVFAGPDAPGDGPGQDRRENEGPLAEEPPQPCGASATERPPEPAAVADDLTLEAIETDLAALSGAEAEQPSEPEEETLPEEVPASRPRPSKPAQHRDRRGQRRPAQPKMAAASSEASPTSAAVLRTPADARLRLIIHPVRRTVSISAVLARPAGYPESITLLLGAGTEIGAYGEDRYDDVDLEWTPSLLSGEVRLDSREGYQWLRSSRRIHIFSEQADEQGLMSVGSAPLNSSSAIVCTQDDAEAVRSAAAACGSAELVSHDRWTGVPEGWAVLSGYRPAHAASMPLDPHLTTLDPGVGAEIRLSGGLQVRSGSFAQGCPPSVEIQPFPAGAQVTIDGMPAEMNSDGCWRAAGWDRPGDHLVDVVPGPSLTYRILGDPWTEGGWESWDAHAGRFLAPNDAPWARAQICGASVSGPSGEHVVAAEAMSSVIALGLRRGVAMLRPRPDAPVAVGLLRETPAFLISSSGPRRIQGRVDWLVPPAGTQLSRMIDLSWVAVVRSAASRRLPLSADSPAGQEAWRRARARARRYRKAGA